MHAATNSFPSRQTLIRALIIGALSTSLVACGGGGGPSGADLISGGSSGNKTPTPTTPTAAPTAAPITAAKLNLNWDKTSVKTGGKDTATLTITALNSSNGILAGATIVLDSTSGILSGTVVTTNATGQAKVTYTAGSNLNNRTESISVTSGAFSTTTALKVTGTALVLSTANSSLSSGTKTDLTATVKDGEGNPAANVDVIFSASGTGSLSFAQATVQTDSSGIATTKATAGASGTSIATATSQGTAKTTSITISGGSNQFTITSPTAAVIATTTGTTQTVTVSASAATTVVFITTLGTWSNGKTIQEVAVTGGVASAILNNPNSGTATVQVYDKATPSTSSTFQAIVSAPVANANSISIQASPSVIAPSTATQKNSLGLTATVLDSAGKPIANAPVSFEITNSLGGGEYISPAAIISGDGTDPSLGLGQAKSSFYSGSLPSGQTSSSVTVVAKVLLPNGTTISSTAASVIIGGVAGSVSIGESTKIESSTDNTYYQLPMSVLVADSNGSPMANTTVNLSTWPLYYSTGSSCLVGATFKAEDANENLILNAGEDGSISRVSNSSFATILLSNPINGVTPTSITGIPDGILSPINSAAGSVPTTVTTDTNGIASFKYTYLKSNALWTVVRFRASTMVQGTEARSETVFRLRAAEADVTTCYLPDSPYNSIVNIKYN